MPRPRHRRRKRRVSVYIGEDLVRVVGERQLNFSREVDRNFRKYLKKRGWL